MKCKIVQRRRSSMSQPERVSANLRAHLAHCAACREGHSQLILLKRNVPRLPIPASNGKSRLLCRLLAEKRCQEPFRAPAAASNSYRSPKRFLTPFFVPSVAAALLLIALGWLGLQGWLDRAPPARQPVTDALLASLVQR